MNYPNLIPHGSPGIANFAKNLWLAATANHEAMQYSETRVNIAVANDTAATELRNTVIEYARNAFRTHLTWENDQLVWPNGATMTITVHGRTQIRGERPALTAADEITVIDAATD